MLRSAPRTSEVRGAAALADGRRPAARVSPARLPLVQLGPRAFLAEAVGPEEDACDVERSQVGGRALVVAGRDASPLFDPVDAAFDGVALPIGSLVEFGGRPPALPRRRR
jgi:hypothetical protein